MEDIDPTLSLRKKKIRIAMLGSYTLNNLSLELKKELQTSTVEADIKIGGFDQYVQELLDRHSWLASFAPDIIIVALSFRTVFSELKYTLLDMSQQQLEEYVDQKLSFLSEAISSTAHTGTILVTSLDTPHYSPLGILESKKRAGIKMAVERWNNTLESIVEQKTNTHIIDFEKVCSFVGKARVTDEKMFYLGKLFLSSEAASAFAKELATFIRAIFGEAKKCMVVDLDNTLWKGVIGEDGIGGIVIDDSTIGAIYRDIQKVLLNLKKRGILLAIVSKNNVEDVKEVFVHKEGMILKEHDFVATRINWERKSDNIISIAKELNIGTDSMVFLDDNPAERLEVKAHLPEVEVIDFPDDVAQVPLILKSLSWFESLNLTDEDKKRHELYLEEGKRKAQREGASVNDYLASLGTKMYIRKNDKNSLERITQLINKTNQFNLRTQRYSADEVLSFMSNPSSFVASVHVIDRFGELGLTAIAIIKKTENQTYFIDSFLMSCRIMSRDIEKQFMAELVSMLPSDCRILLAEYIATKKNSVVADFYDRMGFVAEEIGSERKTYMAELPLAFKKIPYIEVKQHG